MSEIRRPCKPQCLRLEPSRRELLRWPARGCRKTARRAILAAGTSSAYLDDAPITKGRPQHNKQRNVIVADDSVSMRSLVCLTLKSLGLNAVEAANGHDALERIKTLPSVDLVIADLNMPLVDGLTWFNVYGPSLRSNTYRSRLSQLKAARNRKPD